MLDAVAVAGIAHRHRLELVLLFGSAARGLLHPHSDLDIAIHAGGRGLALGELAQIQHELQDLSPERHVDLAVLDRADPLFLDRVVSRCLRLAGPARRLAELRILAFKRYQDHRRFLELERRYVERHLARLAAGAPARP